MGFLKNKTENKKSQIDSTRRSDQQRAITAECCVTTRRSPRLHAHRATSTSAH